MKKNLVYLDNSTSKIIQPFLLKKEQLLIEDVSPKMLQNIDEQDLFKYKFKQLDEISKQNIICNTLFSEENLLGVKKMIVYLIAPHNQHDIKDSEDHRLSRIKILFERYSIDVNMYEIHFFTTFLNFSIFFRQEKIALHFIELGADINLVDSLGLSPINYLCAKILIGNKENPSDSMLNEVRDRIPDKAMINVLNALIEHKSQKLEYFHKNPATGYCIYDAYATSQVPNMPSASGYLEIYKILSKQVQKINLDNELSKHYAVELVEFKGSFSSDNRSPQFFNQFKNMKKSNIFEYIISSDEEGALEFLNKNPGCILVTDIDMQSPLHWAIFMSQHDKPKRLKKLIIELIKNGSDIEQYNITGYNAIELAAWYDHTESQSKGIENSHYLLKIIEQTLDLIEDNKFTKSREEIKEFRKIVNSRKEIVEIDQNQQKKLQLLKLIKNDKELKLIKDEEKNIKRELNLMAHEDTRQVEITEKNAFDLIKQLEIDEANTLRVTELKLNKKKSKKQASKAKKQAEKAKKESKEKAALEEEKAKKEAKIQAKKEAREKAELEAKAKAELKELEKARNEAIKLAKANARAEIDAKNKAVIQAKKIEDLRSKIIVKQNFKIQSKFFQAFKSYINKCKLISKQKLEKDKVINVERNARIKAEKDFEEAKIVAIRISQEAEKYKKELEETKKALESHENDSSTSEITDGESYEDVSYDSNNFHNQQYGPAFIQYSVNHYPQPIPQQMPIPIHMHPPVFYGNHYPMAHMIPNQYYYQNYDNNIKKFDKKWKHPYQPTQTVYYPIN